MNRKNVFLVETKETIRMGTSASESEENDCIDRWIEYDVGINRLSEYAVTPPEVYRRIRKLIKINETP